MRSIKKAIRKMIRFYSAVLAGTLITILLGGSVAWQVISYDLPSINHFDERKVPEATLILDRHGEKLFELFAEERRVITPLDQINPQLINAVIVAEDKNFYQHHGFDLTAIFRAMVENLSDDLAGEPNDFLQGGSTITQQLMKNTLLNPERTVTRKLKEAILSVQLEQKYDKNTILASYLNEIGFGSNAFGVEAAAQTFFHKSAAELTLAESATLAVLPQRPSYYSPYGSHLDQLFTRKEYILDQMALEGYITTAEAEAAKQAAPSRAEPNFQTYQGTITAPHFVQYVQAALVAHLGSDEEAYRRLAQGGYVITTSLDLKTQRLAEETVAKHRSNLKRYGAENAGLIVLDTTNGEILAMVGSVDFYQPNWGAVNVTARPRSPGSAFKPIVYATALNNGYTAATVIQDQPVQFTSGNQTYEPFNYDRRFRGPVTLRQALNLSLNVPAVKTINEIGVSKVVEQAQALGLSTFTDDRYYGLSTALGATEVRLDELANAFATLGNEGVYHSLKPIIKLTRRDGSAAPEAMPDYQEKQVINPEIAFIMSDVLADTTIERSLFGRALVVAKHEVAAKTGTSEAWRDGWTVGFDPQVTVGVWVGNNDNRPMRNGADGSNVAAPIWNEFITTYLKDAPQLTFTKPAETKKMAVDRATGKLTNPQCNQNTVAEWFASFNAPSTWQNCAPVELFANLTPVL